MSNIPQSNTQSNSQIASILSHVRKHEKLDPNDPLTKNAQQLVAQSFYGTLMKQASKSPFHSDMFEGGKGGEAYQEMFNEKIAEHMSRGAGSKLVRPLVHKFQANKAYQKHKTAHKKHHAHGFGAHAPHTAGTQASSFLSGMGA